MSSVVSTEARLIIRVRSREKGDFWSSIGFFLPSFLILAVFFFYPIVKTVYLSLFLTDAQGQPKHFIGWQQYLNLFSQSDFLPSLLTTLEFVLLTVIPGIVIALCLALLLEKQIRGLAIFQTIIFSPISMSAAAISTIGLMMFNPSVSLLNYLLTTLFHVPSINWLTFPFSALVAVSVLTVWMNLGFSTIILLGALRQVPSELNDSSYVDGANYFQRIWHVALPSISPSLFFVLVVSVIGAFQTFGQVNILTQGGPANATNLVVYSIYRNAFFNYQYGLGSAEAFILFIIILILTAIQFLVLERRVVYA